MQYIQMIILIDYDMEYGGGTGKKFKAFQRAPELSLSRRKYLRPLKAAELDGRSVPGAEW